MFLRDEHFDEFFASCLRCSRLLVSSFSHTENSFASNNSPKNKKQLAKLTCARWRIGSPWKVQIMNVNKKPAVSDSESDESPSPSRELAITHSSVDAHIPIESIFVSRERSYRETVGDFQATADDVKHMQMYREQHHPATHKAFNICARSLWQMANLFITSSSNPKSSESENVSSKFPSSQLAKAFNEI